MSLYCIVRWLLHITVFSRVINCQIGFYSQPADVEVYKGQTAIFNCSYYGTQDVAIWHINGIYYTVGARLPPRYSLTQYYFIVENISYMDNGSTFQCLIFDQKSNTGTLLVKGILVIIIITNGSNGFFSKQGEQTSIPSITNFTHTTTAPSEKQHHTENINENRINISTTSSCLCTFGIEYWTLTLLVLVAIVGCTV